MSLKAHNVNVNLNPVRSEKRQSVVVNKPSSPRNPLLQ
jgi:hypothetical protein